MKCCLLWEEAASGFFQQVCIRNAKEHRALGHGILFYLWFWSFLGSSHELTWLFIIFISLLEAQYMRIL